MSDTTEPAIPVRAALPVPAHRDLLDMAEELLPTLKADGLRLGIDVTEQKGLCFEAVLTAHDWDTGAIVETKTVEGWRVGAVVQWTPGRSKRR